MFFRKLINFFHNAKITHILSDDKLDESELLKNQLADKIAEHIPREFVDFFNEELIQDPVLTESGQVFERSSIEKWLENNAICPLTREPLARDELIASKRMKAVLIQFKKYLTEVLKEIDLSKTVGEENYSQERVDDFKNNVVGFLHWFNLEKQEATQEYIQSIKNAKQLDIHNVRHLNYWSEKNACLNAGLVTVTCQHQKFYLTHTIYNVLKVANANYSRATDFRRTLKVAQASKAGCWVTYWGRTANNKRMQQADFSNTQRMLRAY